MSACAGRQHKAVSPQCDAVEMCSTPRATPGCRARHAVLEACANARAAQASGCAPSAHLKAPAALPRSHTWLNSHHPPAGPKLRTKRFSTAAGVLGGAVYATGGYNGAYLQSAERLDPREGKWQEVRVLVGSRPAQQRLLHGRRHRWTVRLPACSPACLPARFLAQAPPRHRLPGRSLAAPCPPRSPHPTLLVSRRPPVPPPPDCAHGVQAWRAHVHCGPRRPAVCGGRLRRDQHGAVHGLR